MRPVIQKVHPDSEVEWVDVPTDEGWPDGNVVTALKELQIKVVSVVPDIRDVIEAGRY
jgi:hypothetical protein